MGSHQSVLNPNRYFFLLIVETERRGGRLRRAYRRRRAAARARGRGREEAERLGEEGLQLDLALADHGDLGRHQGVFPGGGELAVDDGSVVPGHRSPRRARHRRRGVLGSLWVEGIGGGGAEARESSRG